MSKTYEETIANLKGTKQVLKERGRTTHTLIHEDTNCACLLGGAGIAVGGEEFIAWPNYDYFYGSETFDVRGAAYEEVQALAAVLPDEFFESTVDVRCGVTTLEQRRAVAGYNDVYNFNDRQGEGPEGDAVIDALIDRAIERLEKKIIARDLRKAADEIESRGWAKGSLITFEGKCCALGAIGVATVGEETVDAKYYNVFDIPEAHNAATAFAQHLKENGLSYTTASDISPVYNFNDANGRTAEEVIAELHAAADAVEAGL